MLDRVWFPNCSTSPAERGQGEQSRNRGGEDEAKGNGPLTIKEESCQGHARDGRAGEVTEGRGSWPRPAARAPARAARPSPRAASASRLVPQLPGHPLGLFLRRARCLCPAARFTPENPTAGRASSLVMIKVEAVGGGGKHPFRNSACFKFRFKTALGDRLSPSFRKKGRLPGVA
ncbi:hypothetical protein E2I00_004438, partial [Balaenoptera physalus]